MSTNDDLPRSDERAVAVRLRDHERCQACNRTASKFRLEVHRIVPGDRAANQMSNFILLCADCHDSAHSRKDHEEGSQYGA